MLREEVGKVIVGQTYMMDRLLIALLADGHVLLEGVPGLAKTLAIKTLAGNLIVSPLNHCTNLPIVSYQATVV